MLTSMLDGGWLATNSTVDSKQTHGLLAMTAHSLAIPGSHWLTVQLLLALTITVSLRSVSHGTQGEPSDLSLLLLVQSQSQSQSQSYFTTGGLPPISSSWRQAPWDPRPDFFFQLNSCGNSPYVASSLSPWSGYIASARTIQKTVRTAYETPHRSRLPVRVFFRWVAMTPFFSNVIACLLFNSLATDDVSCDNMKGV
jgi:hypothetical protein